MIEEQRLLEIKNETIIEAQKFNTVLDDISLRAVLLLEQEVELNRRLISEIKKGKVRAINKSIFPEVESLDELKYKFTGKQLTEDPTGDNQKQKIEQLTIHETEKQDFDDQQEINNKNNNPTNKQRVVKFIYDTPRKHAKEIAGVLNIDKGNLSRILKSLVAEKIIEQDTEGGYQVVKLKNTTTDKQLHISLKRA